MDEIPFEERRVIHALVIFWQTRNEHPDLVRSYPDLLRLIDRCSMGTSFFWQVYHDLCSDRRSEYTASSASEFQRFLEAEYRQPTRAYADRRAQAKAEEREEYEKRARANFVALGKEMVKATTRAELIELGRKRADLAPHTGISYVYENHCWNCKTHISSAIHARCPKCKLYICGSCGSCFC